MKFEVGNEVVYKDQPATVTGVSRGWYTVDCDDGLLRKVRTAELSLAPDSSDDERDMKTQMAKARQKYVKVKNYAGERSMDNGDSLAQLMRGLEPSEVCSLADTLFEEEVGHHHTRYGHLNPGQQRMNSGNRIRSGVKRELFTVDRVSAAFKELGLYTRGQD
jgi:hypothetical protein